MAPAARQTTLQDFAPGLYLSDGQKRFYGFRLQRCMTVVVLTGGGLLIHSPNTLDEALKRALDELGPVEHVICPNKIHNHAVDAFAEAYPRARILAAAGLPERCPQLAFDGVLTDAPDPAWADVLDQVGIKGNIFFEEVVFFHRPSHTLIVTDLVENLRSEHLSVWGRLMCRLFGVYGRPVASPEHSLYTFDADAAEASFERVLEWDFERIVLAHGRRIEVNGRAVFRQVTEELLTRVRRRGPLRRWLYRWFARHQ